MPDLAGLDPSVVLDTIPLERKALVLDEKAARNLTGAQNEEVKVLNASLEVKALARTAELSVANDN